MSLSVTCQLKTKRNVYVCTDLLTPCAEALAEPLECSFCRFMAVSSRCVPSRQASMVQQPTHAETCVLGVEQACHAHSRSYAQLCISTEHCCDQGS